MAEGSIRRGAEQRFNIQNNAFGPRPRARWPLATRKASYKNPADRGKYWQSKGRQQPTVNLHLRGEGHRGYIPESRASGGYRRTDAGERVPYGTVKGA